MLLRRAAFVAIASAAFSAGIAAAAGERQERAGYRFEVVLRGFREPVHAAIPASEPNNLYVVERRGRIRVVVRGRMRSKPFLDLRGRVALNTEQGLLSMAFHPAYVRNRKFYVFYTERRTGAIRIVEYRARNFAAVPGSARQVAAVSHPGDNHNGGQLAFGPDGLLYIGLGDGGGGDDLHGRRGNAQNLGTVLGKILRIDPRPSGGRPYRIPAGNPFVGRSGARGEIYSYGLRNPWRFSFDRETGDLAIGDVGQDEIEEIDFVRRDQGRGANFGWRPFEGNSRIYEDEQAPGHVRPVIEKTHDDGWCSITGGYIVRDPAVPALTGRYVYGDYCKGQLRSARLREGGAQDDRSLRLRTIGGLSSFGEDAQGRVYVVSLNGPVYRLVQR
jgi:glucose/arabinose dehydrogenase